MWTYPTVRPDIIFSTQCTAGVVKDVLPIPYFIKISPKACFCSSSLEPFKNILSFHGISHKKSYCIPHQDNFSEVWKLDFSLTSLRASKHNTYPVLWLVKGSQAVTTSCYHSLPSTSRYPVVDGMTFYCLSLQMLAKGHCELGFPIFCLQSDSRFPQSLSSLPG